VDKAKHLFTCYNVENKHDLKQNSLVMKEKELLQDLLSKNSELRQNATRALWNFWFSLAGEIAESRIRKGTLQMDSRQPELARQTFEDLVKDFPEFAEAHNKLATVLYLQRKYLQSIKECEITLRLNPNHFGAWNGHGLCLFQLARYTEAIKSFKKALIIQPYAEFNKIYIAKCRGQLN